MPMKTESTSHTETASHLAPSLCANAQCSTVVIGDIDGLNEDRFAVRSQTAPLLDRFAVRYAKEIFLCSVFGYGFGYRRMATNGVAGFERFAPFERDIGHLIKGSRTAHIDPLCQLLTSKTRQPNFLGHRLQFF